MKKMIRRIMALALCLMMCLSAMPLEARAAGDVIINETNFPDPIFREYVSSEFDYDGDGVLSQEERENVEYILVEGSNISSLVGIEHFPYLRWLDCQRNNLTTLDVSKSVMLTTLICANNALTSLDVSKNEKLTDLYCYSNNLTALDVSKNTKLEHFWCDDNKLTTLDVSKNTKLIRFDCSSNALTTLDISKNTKLQQLWCDDNKLTTLDISKNTELFILECYYNSLTTLDIRNNPDLIKAVTEGTKVDDEKHGIVYYKYVIDEWFDYHLGYDDSVNLIYKAAKPKITTQPKNASVKAGKKVTFKVKAVGEGLKYQWYRLKPGTKKWEKIKKATKASYSFKAAKKWNGYKFRCVVSNAAGKATSKSVKLKVK